MHGRSLFAFLLALFVAIVNVLVALPLAFYLALAKCDESCNQDPSRGWRDDPHAWQWNALVWITIVGAVFAISLPISVGLGSRRAGWIAAVGYTLAGGAFLVLVFAPYTSSASGLSGSDYRFIFALCAIPTIALASAWLTPPPVAQSTPAASR